MGLELLSLEVTRNENIPECKGIYVRYHRNIYFSKGAMNYNHRFQILSKMSCPGCEKCDRMCFENDIDMGGAEDLPFDFKYDDLEDGCIYKLRWVEGGRDFETGYVDDWWWELDKCEMLEEQNDGTAKTNPRTIESKKQRR